MNRGLLPALLIATLMIAAPGTARLNAQDQSTTVIYLVRHAETEADGTQDPSLSPSGLERAAQLSRMLAGAGLTAIYSTPYSRTQETAGAVAETAELMVHEYDPADLQGFAAELLEQPGHHLVVGHSNTTPELVRLLGGEPRGMIPEDEYGRLYVLTIDDGAVYTLISGYPGGFTSDITPAHQEVVEARIEDVESVESILAALYDVLSGPAGEARDWDRLRSLFLQSARMVPVQRAPDGDVRYRALTVEEYVESSAAVIEDLGFRETEIAREVEHFGEVAHVFSTYEAFREGVEEPIMRGLNSIQLINDGARWWIASLAWVPERADLPIPPRYEADEVGS